MQCVGSEKIWSNPDPTLPVIPDLDPTSKVFQDPISDPSQNQTFWPSQKKKDVQIN